MGSMFFRQLGGIAGGTPESWRNAGLPVGVAEATDPVVARAPLAASALREPAAL